MELGYLSPLYDRPGPWASVYFDTTTASQDAAARQRLGARSACERLEGQGADKATCRAVYDTLVSLPRGPNPPGHAVFATGGEVVLDTALTSVPPGGGHPHACWEALPHTGPLLEYAETEPVCLVAYIDRTGADFEVRGPLGAHGAGHVAGEDWPVHRTASKDPSEGHFQNAVENTWEHNAGLIADALRSRREETGAELVVLAGDTRECRAVHDRLPPDLRGKTIEAEHGARARTSRGTSRSAGNTAGGERLLDEEIAAARAEQARRHAGEALESFRAGRVPDGAGTVNAAEGVPALVEAAREHRIGSLLIRPDGPDVHREVWVGAEPDQVAVRRTDTRYLGEPDPSAARADDALLRSATVTGADVLCVRTPDLPEGLPDGLPAGGMGALLRWPYGGTQEGG